MRWLQNIQLTPPGWTPSLGLLSSAGDGLTVMRYVHYADGPVLSPVHLIEVVSTHDLAQLALSGDGGWPFEGRKESFSVVIAFGSFPVGAVVCGFSLLLLLCFSFCYLHAVHLGAPPKGTTTRLKATARAPLGVASRGDAV